MDSPWFPAMTTEQQFEVRRQQIGLVEMAEQDPRRVGQLCASLLHLVRVQELALRGAMARVIELEHQQRMAQRAA
jgi:hypothetical protein